MKIVVNIDKLNRKISAWLWLRFVLLLLLFVTIPRLVNAQENNSSSKQVCLDSKTNTYKSCEVLNTDACKVIQEDTWIEPVMFGMKPITRTINEPHNAYSSVIISAFWRWEDSKVKNDANQSYRLELNNEQIECADFGNSELAGYEVSCGAKKLSQNENPLFLKLSFNGDNSSAGLHNAKILVRWCGPTAMPTSLVPVSPTITPSPKPSSLAMPATAPSELPTPTPVVVTTAFTIEKQVRAQGSSQWQHTVQDVLVNSALEFLITVKNTGNTDVTDLQVIDVMPSFLELTSEKDHWSIETLAVGEAQEFVVKSRVRQTNDINKKACLPNVANLIYNNEKEASSLAVVCLHPEDGQVLGIAQILPPTGVSSALSTGAVFVLAISAGIFLSRLGKQYLQKS